MHVAPCQAAASHLPATLRPSDPAIATLASAQLSSLQWARPHSHEQLLNCGLGHPHDPASLPAHSAPTNPKRTASPGRTSRPSRDKAVC